MTISEGWYIMFIVPYPAYVRGDWYCTIPVVAYVINSLIPRACAGIDSQKRLRCLLWSSLIPRACAGIIRLSYFVFCQIVFSFGFTMEDFRKKWKVRILETISSVRIFSFLQPKIYKKQDFSSYFYWRKEEFVIY